MSATRPGAEGGVPRAATGGVPARVRMTWAEQRKALESLNDRDKRLLALARRIYNQMGFALQNPHNERAQERYEREASAAMDELFALLLEGKTELTT